MFKFLRDIFFMVLVCFLALAAIPEDDAVKIKSTKAWKGKSVSGVFRSVKYSYPADWKFQLIDSIETIKTDSGGKFKRYKISFFPPGEQTYTDFEMGQLEETNLNIFEKRIKEELKTWLHGKQMYFKKNPDPRYPSFEMAYTWDAETAKKNIFVHYVQYARFIKVKGIIYRLCYAAFREDFYTFLSKGKFMMNSIAID